MQCDSNHHHSKIGSYPLLSRFGYDQVGRSQEDRENQEIHEMSDELEEELPSQKKGWKRKRKNSLVAK